MKVRDNIAYGKYNFAIQNNASGFMILKRISLFIKKPHSISQ